MDIQIKEKYKDKQLCLDILNIFNMRNTMLNKQYDNYLLFSSKCLELEKKSEYKYKIQKTLELNKNFFHGFLLDSQICDYLKNTGHINYSIEELKRFIVEFGNSIVDDSSPYLMAAKLYEFADNIERLVDNRIKEEINVLSKLDSSIKKIDKLPKDKYQNLYNEIKSGIEKKLLQTNIIDDYIMELSILILNDIFDYYINGYPNLPEDYYN